MEKTNIICFRKLRQFVLGLKNQEVKTKIDFENYYESKWQMSRNKMILKAVGTDGIGNFRARKEENLRVT